MPRPRRELKEIVAAVSFHPEGGFSVAGSTVAAAEDGAASGLAAVLYHKLYCRPEQGDGGGRGDGRAARVFAEALSQANCGRGTWEPGWIVRSLEADGRLAVHNPRQDLMMWALPGQYRGEGDVAVGATGRLWVGKEWREMLPGYYMALGDADEADARADLVRFYFHLTPAAAVRWIAELTRRLNAAGVAFRAKALSDPAAYLRADAGVLYVSRQDLGRVMEVLPGLYDAVAPDLRRSVPMFTKRLAPGLAVAEDPGDGRSFGQHRCQLVAEGLVRAFGNGAEASAAIAARFSEAGLDVARPWLNAGSRNVFVWRA